MNDKLSYAMRERLKKVANGGWDGKLFQCSNTNTTMEALKKRGMVEMAPDQSKARILLNFAWIITEKGRAELGNNR